VTLTTPARNTVAASDRLADERSPVSMAKRDRYCGHRLDPSVGEARRPRATKQDVDPTGQVAAVATLIAGSI
jgi:hypothetical protein